jgi:hypothetical protein
MFVAPVPLSAERRQATRMSASYDSVCEICWDGIEPGETIVHVDAAGWVHEECGTEFDDAA